MSGLANSIRRISNDCCPQSHHSEPAVPDSGNRHRAAILVGGVIIVAMAKPATATPAYAAQTKLACRPVPREFSRRRVTYQFWQSLCRDG